MPKVRFVKEGLCVDACAGSSLRRVALDAGVALHGPAGPRLSCGGRGVCGTCRVRVAPGPALTPPWTWEELRLPAHGQRLACQCEVLDDVEVETRPGRGPRR